MDPKDTWRPPGLNPWTSRVFKNLSFSSQIKAITKSAFYYLNAINIKKKKKHTRLSSAGQTELQILTGKKDKSLIYRHRSRWIKTQIISLLYDAPEDSQTALTGQEHLICMNLTHSSPKNSRDRWCYETRETLRAFTRVHDAISKNSLVQTNTDLETKQFRLPWAHWTSPGALGQFSSAQ